MLGGTKTQFELGGVKAEFEFELTYLGLVDLVQFREIYAMLYSPERSEQLRGLELIESLDDTETFLSYKEDADATEGTVGYIAQKWLAARKQLDQAEHKQTDLLRQLSQAERKQVHLESDFQRLKHEKQQILQGHAKNNCLTPSYQTKKASAPGIKSTTNSGYHHYTPTNRKSDKDKCNVM